MNESTQRQEELKMYLVEFSRFNVSWLGSEWMVAGKKMFCCGDGIDDFCVNLKQHMQDNGVSSEGVLIVAVTQQCRSKLRQSHERILEEMRDALQARLEWEEIEVPDLPQDTQDAIANLIEDEHIGRIQQLKKRGVAVQATTTGVRKVG